MIKKIRTEAVDRCAVIVRSWKRRCRMKRFRRAAFFREMAAV